MGFRLKGITLDVEPTDAMVKADKTLTLFMVNTLADNARKFTPRGGRVSISAKETADYVEVSVSDNGQGMTEEQTAHIFDHKPIIDGGGMPSLSSGNGQSLLHGTDTPISSSLDSTPNSQRSHGFGLMNCKGIIDKYRTCLYRSGIPNDCRL